MFKLLVKMGYKEIEAGRWRPRLTLIVRTVEDATFLRTTIQVLVQA